MGSRLTVSILLFLFIIAASVTAKTEEARFMTKEQLRPLLGSADVIIIDVRTKYDWDTSKIKIPGAVKEEGMKFGTWMNKYPKDKTIVIYCAWVNDSTSVSLTQAYTKAGYGKVYYLKGGLRGAWHEWTKAKYPTEAK